MIENMPAAEYHASAGLSGSGMKDLDVSPLRYWFKNLRPDREPEEPSAEMKIGSALHCAVLEPSQFEARYCKGIEQDDFEYCLDTVDEMRLFIRDKGREPKGTKKADIIKQVLDIDPNANIWAHIQARFILANKDREIIKPAEFQRVLSMKKAITAEPEFQKIMQDPGFFEASFFARDPATQVPLKCRMDLWQPKKRRVEIKTFSQKYGKSIDTSVNHAIWYEGYHHQGYIYAMVESLEAAATGEAKVDAGSAQRQGPHVMFFVESEEPHEVRIRVLSPRTAGEVNAYWEHSRVHVRRMIDLYAECHLTFGENAWRYVQKADPLLDMDLPAALAFQR